MRPLSPGKPDPAKEPMASLNTNLAECAAIAAVLMALAAFLWGLTQPGFRTALGATLAEVGRVVAGAGS